MDTLPGPASKEFAETLEQEPPGKWSLLRSRADDHREHQSGECSPVSYHVLVGGIDFGGAHSGVTIAFIRSLNTQPKMMPIARLPSQLLGRT